MSSNSSSKRNSTVDDLFEATRKPVIEREENHKDKSESLLFTQSLTPEESNRQKEEAIRRKRERGARMRAKKARTRRLGTCKANARERRRGPT